MGREINVSAGDRLNLQDAGCSAPDALCLLETAYNKRLAQVGGRAVVLDAVIEIARGQGYTGSLDEAIGVLRVAGYSVEAGPSGRPIAWREPP